MTTDLEISNWPKRHFRLKAKTGDDFLVGLEDAPGRGLQRGRGRRRGADLGDDVGDRFLHSLGLEMFENSVDRLELHILSSRMTIL